MEKTKLLSMIRTERARWETLLAEVGEAQMTQRGVEGEWSVKDIITHVTAYERWIVVRLDSALRGEMLRLDIDRLDLEQRNAWIFEENQSRPLEDVLAESQQVYQQLLKLVQALSDEDLADPHQSSRFWIRCGPMACRCGSASPPIPMSTISNIPPPFAPGWTNLGRMLD